MKKGTVLFVVLAVLTTKINGMCSLAPGQCAAADVSVIMAFKRSGALSRHRCLPESQTALKHFFSFSFQGEYADSFFFFCQDNFELLFFPRH